MSQMYSLGIIFFEMCFPYYKTTQERIIVLSNLRKRDHTLPAEFNDPSKAIQGDIIRDLVSHQPSKRPSSTELLQSGKIPMQIENETIQQALQGLSDSRYPYYQKMMTALFSQQIN